MYEIRLQYNSIRIVTSADFTLFKFELNDDTEPSCEYDYRFILNHTLRG